MTYIRKNRILIGLFILSAFVFYGIGQSLITSQPIAGLLMVVVNSIIVGTIGFKFKYLLGDRGRGIQKTYLVARIIEAILLVIGVLFLYLQEINRTSLSVETTNLLNNLGYNLGMISLGIGSVVVFYKSIKLKIFPNWISIWGVIGYIFLALGSVMNIPNIGASIYFLIPGGLFEVVFAFWLIFKGTHSNK